MSEDDRHRHAALLLPWYVNGTLGERDRDAVSAHVSECLACREELARCQTLAATVQNAHDAAWAPAPDRLSRLLASIELIEAEDARRAGWRAQWRSAVEWLGDVFERTPHPVRWGFAAQAALLVLVVGLAFWTGVVSPPAPYRTLAENGAPRAGGARIHLVFAENVTEHDMRTLLARVQGTIVDGPSPLGVYTVEIGAGAPDQVMPMVGILRSDPKVRLAEPLPRR